MHKKGVQRNWIERRDAAAVGVQGAPDPGPDWAGGFKREEGNLWKGLLAGYYCKSHSRV